MPEFTFSIEHTIVADTKKEARKEFQEHLDAGNFPLDKQRDWFCKKEEAISNICYSCQNEVVKWGDNCPSCGRLNN